LVGKWVRLVFNPVRLVAGWGSLVQHLLLPVGECVSLAKNPVLLVINRVSLMPGLTLLA
jgi:hypothetical protein